MAQLCNIKSVVFFILTVNLLYMIKVFITIGDVFIHNKNYRTLQPVTNSNGEDVKYLTVDSSVGNTTFSFSLFKYDHLNGYDSNVIWNKDFEEKAKQFLIKYKTDCMTSFKKLVNTTGKVVNKDRICPCVSPILGKIVFYVFISCIMLYFTYNNTGFRHNLMPTVVFNEIN